MSSESRFSKIIATVATLGAWSRVDSKYLVYYDGPVNNANKSAVREAGSGDGQGVAIVYTAACTDIANEVVAADELMHAFGALPEPGPPHACPDSPGHPCDSSGDVLYPYVPFAKLVALGLDVGTTTTTPTAATGSTCRTRRGSGIWRQRRRSCP